MPKILLISLVICPYSFQASRQFFVRLMQNAKSMSQIFRGYLLESYSNSFAWLALPQHVPLFDRRECRIFQ